MSPLSKDQRYHRMIAAYVLMVVAFAGGLYWVYRISEQQQQDRRVGGIINCRNNQAQDDVLRAILRPSIESTDPVTDEERTQLVHTYERVLGKTPGDKSPHDMRLELVEHLMGPLGGYQTTPKEQAELCRKRLEQAGLEPEGS